MFRSLLRLGEERWQIWELGSASPSNTLSTEKQSVCLNIQSQQGRWIGPLLNACTHIEGLCVHGNLMGTSCRHHFTWRTPKKNGSNMFK